MGKEDIHSRVGQEIRSCHPYAFRSGQWALIKSVSKHSGGDDMWLVEWPDGVTDICAPWDYMARYEFRDHLKDPDADKLVFLLRNELNHDAQVVAEHLAWVLREAGYGKVTLKCVCGDMLQDASIVCGMHPEIRVRTFNQRMDFEQAFDANVERNKKVMKFVETEDNSKGSTGASLEDLENAPVGARAVTADDRVIEKTPVGWVVAGFITEVGVRPDYEEVSSETAMNLSPLYLIGEYK